MNTARRWLKRHRMSAQIKDALDGWDEAGGQLAAKADASNWTVFPIVASTVPLTPERLRRLLGNPLTEPEED